MPKWKKAAPKSWKDDKEQDIKSPPKKKTTKKKTVAKAEEILEDAVESDKTPKVDVAALLKKAPRAKIPAGVKPMKATLVDEPFNDPDWIYEVKWDGYRAIATIDKKGGADLTQQYTI